MNDRRSFLLTAGQTIKQGRTNMRRSLRKGARAAAVISLTLGGAAMAAQDKGGKDPIEGVWDERTTIIQCGTGAAITTVRGMAMFGPGGRAIVVPATVTARSAGLGTWRHLDGHSYTAFQQMFVFNTDGSFAGTSQATVKIELSTNANEYTDTVTVEIFDTSDQLVSTACATTTATRL